MDIKRYSQADEALLFDMLREEGEEWSDYYNQKGYDKYKKALVSSITYVVYDGSTLCGYARCREDDGFGVYVYDLLVRKSCRGRHRKDAHGSRFAGLRRPTHICYERRRPLL